MHVSKDPNKVFKRKKFHEPSIHKSGGLYQHDFNMDGALYLSKVDDDDEKSSMWLRFRKLSEKYPQPPYKRYNRKTKTTEEIPDPDVGKPDPWLNGKIHYFDVDFETHHIYVVNTPEDLKNLFLKYGYFSQRVKYNRETHTWASFQHDEKRFKMMKKLQVLNQFMENLNDSDKERMKDSHKVVCVKASRDVRNMPHVKITKKTIVVPKKGYTFEFLVDLIRTKESLEKIVGDFSNVEISTYLRAIDFPKMVKDGYNGVYYSTNIVKFASQEQLDNIYEDDNSDHELRHWQKLLERPDIGEMPYDMPFCTKEDMDDAKKGIEQYIQWIGSDTLILWKWIWQKNHKFYLLKFEY